MIQKQTDKIEWREVALGDKTYFEITMGQSPSGETYNKEKKGTPFFQGKAEFGKKYPSVEKWTTDPCKFAKPEDILMSVRAPVGSINMANINCCIGRGLASIRCNNYIEKDFVYYFLKLNEIKIEKLGSGSTFKAITSKQLLNIKIPLPFLNGKPDLETQQKIVSILEKAEELKSKGKKALDLLDEYLKSLFNEMFMGKGFEEVELGDKRYFEIIMGQSPAGSSYNQVRKGVPFFQGKKEFGEKYPIVEQWTSEPSKIALPNDILISVRAPVGSINLANIKCCIGRGLASIRCKKDIKMDFVYSFIKVKEKEIESLGKGSTFKAITSKQLLNIKIPLPPMELQQKFASIVEKVEKLKEKQRLENRNAGELFDSLMQKAFNGELVG